jgi:hypothetical protein
MGGIFSITSLPALSPTHANELCCMSRITSNRPKRSSMLAWDVSSTHSCATHSWHRRLLSETEKMCSPSLSYRSSVHPLLRRYDSISFRLFWRSVRHSCKVRCPFFPGDQSGRILLQTDSVGCSPRSAVCSEQPLVACWITSPVVVATTRRGSVEIRGKDGQRRRHIQSTDSEGTQTIRREITLFPSTNPSPDSRGVSNSVARSS